MCPSRLPKPLYKPVPDSLVNTGVMGFVYVIHFAQPFQHARHYCGWTSNLDERIAHHQLGYGGLLMKAVTVAGIDWEIVRTWKGDRNFERKIKNNGSLARVCPSCSTSPRFARLALT